TVASIARQHRPDSITVVVDQQNRVVTRDHSHELIVAARGGKRAGEPATVLLVDGRGECDAVKPWLVRGGRGMVRIPRAEDDRLAVAFPGTAKVGYRGLRRGGRGDEHCKEADPDEVRHN